MATYHLCSPNILGKYTAIPVLVTTEKLQSLVSELEYDSTTDLLDLRLELNIVAEDWLRSLSSSTDPPDDELPVWQPKNPQCIQAFERARKERLNDMKKKGLAISENDWENPGAKFWYEPTVPFCKAPQAVVTHVHTQVWAELTEEVAAMKLPGWERRYQLAVLVLEQLRNGVSSGVSGPGCSPIQVKNFFLDQEVDPPRVLDALLRAVKDKTMAGPFIKTPGRCRRINSIISVPKPGGERRVVVDLSAPDDSYFPVDRSFNGNVDKELRFIWPLTQLNARQFALMIRSMGTGALMGKSDLTQAYKNMPVVVEQRELQRFMFGDRIFEDLRLIFGDTHAPMFFDRFHHVILLAFVTTPNNIPRSIWGKCIDDIPVVVPANRIDLLRKYFHHYKMVCSKLGVKLSHSEDKQKCFEEETEGEVLGIIFNTELMIWNLSLRKKNSIIRLLRGVIYKPSFWELKRWEIIYGKLNNLAGMWPPGNFFLDSFIFALNMARTKGSFKPNRRVKRDAMVWLAVLEKGDLPIPHDMYGPTLMHFTTFSDASGKIDDSPGIGLLIPGQFGVAPKVAAWEFPRGFLNSTDESGKKCFNKTTCLEAIGVVSILLLGSDILKGNCVVHKVDNIATCLAWERERSSIDQWATTIIRATAHVCAFLNINLHLEWQRRRSDRYTIVVDNLSHDRCEGLTQDEMAQYLSEPMVGFPGPLLRWMHSPRVDYNLGIELVEWLRACDSKNNA